MCWPRVLRFIGPPREAIADFRKAQSIDSADQVSKQQLRMLGF